MAYIIVAYIAMAYIVMAYIVMVWKCLKHVCGHAFRHTVDTCLDID